jgi:hypothetical protein
MRDKEARALIFAGGAFLLFLFVSALGAGVYIALDKKPKGEAASAEAAVGPERDYQTYTAELVRTVPFDVDSLKSSGLKADAHVVDRDYTAFFVELVLRVEPVRLRDAESGKTATYTRARLVRSGLHQPAPIPLRQGGRFVEAPLMNGRWHGVEMLP